MQATVAKRDLEQAAGIVSRAISGTGSLPVLKNVLIEVEPGDKLRLTATDLSVHIETVFSANPGSQPGTSCVPGKVFYEMVASLREGDVRLAEGIDGENRLTVESGRSKFRLHGLKPEDMPSFPGEPEQFVRFQLPQRVLRDLIQRVTPSVSDDDTRPILTTALFQITPGKLEVVTTDTHRLSWTQHGIEPEGLPITDLNEHGNLVQHERLATLVPASALSEVLRLLKDVDEPVQVVCGWHAALFETPATRFYTRVVEGQFPRYERVIPSSHTRRLTCNREDLMACVRRARLIARDSPAKNRVIWTLAPLLLTISAEGEEGRAHEELEGRLEGHEIELALNAEYLLEALGTVKAEEVEITMTEPLAPVTIRGAGDEGLNALVLAMPMQVQ